MEFFSFPDGAAAAPPSGCVAVLGFFDGVHVGHRELFRIAGESGAPVLAWTFRSGTRRGLLTDDETRFRLLSEAGADFVAAADFEAMRDLDGPTFVRDVLAGELGVSRAVSGESFRFGRGAAWNAADLDALCREANIPVTVVPAVRSGDVPVSSSAVREMISLGDAEGAARLLGREHFYLLPVVRGKMIGRLLGFPTANQIVPPALVSPARGVYACRVSFASGNETATFPGVLNVGVCPTLDRDGLAEFRRENPDYRLPDDAIVGAEVMETHVIGYDGDLYGKTVRVDLCRRLRDEKRFGSTDELVRAIGADKEAALGYFKSKEV